MEHYAKMIRFIDIMRMTDGEIIKKKIYAYIIMLNFVSTGKQYSFDNSATFLDLSTEKMIMASAWYYLVFFHLYIFLWNMFISLLSKQSFLYIFSSSTSKFL